MRFVRSLFLVSLGVVALGSAFAQSPNSYQSDGRHYQRGDSQNPDQDGKDRKGSSSRSGRVHYGTMHNLLNKQVRQAPVHIDPAPSRHDLDDGVAAIRDRMRWNKGDTGRDQDHKGDKDDSKSQLQFRVGYYHYRSNFRDDNFYYPYYVFDPYQASPCVVSPWYYYSFLPAYVETNRLVVSPNYGVAFFGFHYNYQADPQNRYYDDDDRSSRFDDNYISHRALDNAVDDIANAFSHQDRRAIDRLVPQRGTVMLGVDGNVQYGVSADDFYDMLTDAVMNSQTVSYEIEDVKSSDDEAEIVAKHVYLDSWGQQQTIYHKFHLFGEHGSVVIRYFETAEHLYW